MDSECAICYSFIFKKDFTSTKCCNQNIHKKCLKDCIHLNNKCPFCRYYYHPLKKDYFTLMIVILNFFNVALYFIINNNNELTIY